MPRELPVGWRSLPLIAIIRALDAGVSVNSESRQKREGEKGILKTSAVSAWDFDPSEHKTILPEEIDRARVSPKADHILLSRMNTPTLVGASAYVDRDHPDLFLPDRLWQIDVKDRRETNVRWLSYVLASDELRKKLSEIATGTSGSMKNIAKNSLLELGIFVPPIDEQRGIADILFSVDEVIQATLAVIEQTRRAKRAVLDHLLLKGTGHSRFKQTTIGEIPEEWDVKALGELCRVQSGFAFNSSDFKATGIPVVRMSNLKSGELELSDAAHVEISELAGLNRYKLAPGDFLFGMSGSLSNFAFVGSGQIPAYLNQRVGRFVNETVDRTFLAAWYLSDSIQSKISKLATGNAQKNISAKQIEALLLPVPTPEEITTISQVWWRYSDAIRINSAILEQLRVTKRELMSDLFTGRKRVVADLATAAE